MSNILNNKAQLAANNTSLREQVLSKVRELPNQTVGGEDLATEVNAQPGYVEAIISQLSKKALASNGEGQYVWEKCKMTTGTITITHLTSATANPTIVQLSSDEINVTEIELEQLAGLITYYSKAGTTTPCWPITFKSNTEILVNGNLKQITWDKQNAQISIPVNFNDLLYLTPFEATIKNDVTYVVASDVNTYPDGGELDGYWYELIEEENAPKINVASDSVNFYIGEVYSEFTKTVAHGLGRKPDYFGITSAIAGNSNDISKMILTADSTNIIFTLEYYSPYRDATFEWFAITVG